tara:strand:- start:1709 stop:1819 length:111 start_codon:yes stop_codon:yes gene_type:complete
MYLSFKKSKGKETMQATAIPVYKKKLKNKDLKNNIF